MGEKEDIIHFVKMLDRGLFPRGKHFVDVRKFELEQWSHGLEVAAEHTGIGKCVVLVP